MTGDLKEMNPKWLMGISLQGYGCSLSVGLGIPIPILNEEMAKYTAISDEDIFTQIVDYGHDYPERKVKKLRTGQLCGTQKRILSGSTVRPFPPLPLSSIVRAREIAETLKKWISKGDFMLGVPQFTLPMK